MISPDLLCFPNNIVELLADALTDVAPESAPGADDGVRIVKRRLRKNDLTQTIGVTPGVWIPEEDSFELGSIEPTKQGYTATVEALVVDSDEERGIATHSALSFAVRHMLYRDTSLMQALAELEVRVGGYTEKLVTWGISQQQFMNNDVNSQFMFLSRLDLWYTTTVQH